MIDDKVVVPNPSQESSQELNQTSKSSDVVVDTNKPQREYKPWQFKPGNKEGKKNLGTHYGYTMKDLIQAIKRLEKRMTVKLRETDKHAKKWNFLDFVLDLASKNPKVMVSILKKLLPDLTMETGDATKVINLIRTGTDTQQSITEPEKSTER